MTESITVRYYDGKRNIPYQAELSLAGERLHIVYGDGKENDYPLRDAAYMAAVGRVLPALELPGDARVEFLNDDVPDWLPLQHKTMLKYVGRFEKSRKWALVGLVTVVCVTVAVFKWGIPAAAYHAARYLPERTLNDAGNQAEKILTGLTGKSGLSAKRRQEISKLYYHKLQPENPAKLLFRSGGEVGANAFALPNNTIVLTDELVALAAHNGEILAVLAHEQGHLKERHGLQQALRGMGIGVFLLVITGDSGDLLANLPAVFISSRYSQGFELEADRHAIHELRRLKLPPQYLTDFLHRLHLHHGHGGENIGSVLSTHPVTSERVKQVEMYVR